jgi:hypothetical protein
VVARHDGPTVPVRVGVPPSKELAEARRVTRLAGGLACRDDAAWLTISRMPATTSTFPFSPLGSFGVLTGSATSWLPEDVW